MMCRRREMRESVGDRPSRRGVRGGSQSGSQLRMAELGAARFSVCWASRHPSPSAVRVYDHRLAIFTGSCCSL